MSLPKSHPGAAFLLTQVGTQAARQFGEQVSQLGITPPHAGILRLIATIAACSQQALAEKLGILPSRMVVLIDELADKGLVERRRSETDRRNYELSLTREGKRLFSKMSAVAAEHEVQFLAVLSNEERTSLAHLLQKIADSHGLIPGVHPGYRNL